MNELNKKIVTGAGWLLFERFSTLGLQLVVSIIMARLIVPKIYGMIALMQVFLNFCNPFVDGGFGMALIQRKNVDDLDFCTVFWFNFVMSALLCAGIWIFAPAIADFYNEPDLVTPLRVFEFVLMIPSITVVNHAILNRRMEFKRNYFITLGGVVAYSVVGITWAFIAPSIWTLIFATLTSQVVRAIILVKQIGWLPKFKYSWQRFKSIFSYSVKLLGNTILGVLSQNFTSLLIGKKFGAVDIAYYDRGKAYPGLIMGILDGTLSKVLFPVFSKKQDDDAALLHYCRMSMSASFFVCFPVLLCFCIVATPFVRLILTERWLPSVPFIRIYSSVCILWVVSGIMQQCLNGRGNSGVVLMFRLVTISSSLFVVWYCSQFGIIIMLLCSAANSYLSFLLFVKIMGKYIGLRFGMVIADLWKILLAGIVSGGVSAFVLSRFCSGANDFFQIVVSASVFFLVYLIALIGMKERQIELMWSIAWKKRNGGQ